MMLAVEILHPFSGDVSIDLRRREIAMAEQQLHYAKIGAPVQQVGGECMAQAVR